MSGRTWSALVAAGIGMVGLGAAADDAIQLDLGKQEYLGKCAVCHGESGVGAGESTEALTRTPGDLVTLARRNGGVYPSQLVWATIDGRTLNASVRAHREMPAWGEHYRKQAESPAEEGVPELFVSQRIGALVDYVSTLQVR